MKYLLLFATLLTLGTQASAQSTHWAFKTPVRAPLPRVKQVSWVKNPIDTFILAKLEAKGLRPSPLADRRTLIRRVTLDLTGLLPTPKEIAEFLADKSPEAYDKVVRRLLASPQYGERWGQHWLDVVRYADSDGFEHDLDRPSAWRYRDWVVNSLNADKPYDQFLREQIAGNEMDPKNFELQVATGFLRTGPFRENAGNPDLQMMRQDWLTETMSTIGNGVLGVTIGCARCHDHKFDPITQRDFYRIQAYFAASDVLDYQPATDAEKKAYDETLKEYKKKLTPYDIKVGAIERPYREKLRAQKMELLPPEYKAALAVEASKRTPEQKTLASHAGTLLNVSWDETLNAMTPEDRAKRAALRKEYHAINNATPQPPATALAVSDAPDNIPKMHILIRGDYHNLGEEVSPGTPPVMGGGANACTPTAAAPKSPGRRTALAEWITRPANPLTARVLVNRAWHYHFGKGIVGTPNDFGKMGEAPTHPELLDWLAVTFSSPASPNANDPKSAGLGWSLKKLHYLIVTSSTYRQSSALDKTNAAVDPDDHLLWRYRPHRMDAETLRDTALQASGLLNLKMGGDAIRIPIEPEVYENIFTEGEPDNLWPVAPDAADHVRRSLYLMRKRNVRLPMLAVFDQPDLMNPCGARLQSVHALQALTLVNSDFMVSQSRKLAKRVIDEAPDIKRSVDLMFQLTLGRSPSAQEAARAEKFLEMQTKLAEQSATQGTKIADFETHRHMSRAAKAAWADLCLATLNLNEYLTID